MRLNFRDERCTVVIVASGPTAADADAELIRGWPCIVVNDAWRLVSFADVLYACDGNWWNLHIDEVRRGFAGELWTQDAEAATRHGLNRIEGKHAAGLGRDVIHFNANSGAQAMNLAWLWGAKRMVLVGFDMCWVGGKEHFFGAHQHQPGKRPREQLRNDSPYHLFIRHMGKLAVDLRREKVEVVNTSAVSRLPYWPKMSLECALVC